MDFRYETTFVTHKQFNAFVKGIEKANMRAHGKSLSIASMRGGDLIVEIQDDRKGMIMRSDWKYEMNHRYLSPTQTPEEILQDVLLKAVEKARKGGQWCVVRFTSQSGAMRYRIYSDTKHGVKAFDDCHIGEEVRCLGNTFKSLVMDSRNPIAFWAEPNFRDEYEALPLYQQYRAEYLDQSPSKPADPTPQDAAKLFTVLAILDESAGIPVPEGVYKAIEELEKPTTIKASQWPEIETDVKADRVKVWLWDRTVSNITDGAHVDDWRVHFTDGGSGLVNDDSRFVLEWRLERAKVESAGEWPLGDLYAAMKSDPGNLEKQVAYYKALADARLNDYYAKIDEVAQLRQQLEAERQRADTQAAYAQNERQLARDAELRWGAANARADKVYWRIIFLYKLILRYVLDFRHEYPPSWTEQRALQSIAGSAIADDPPVGWGKAKIAQFARGRCYGESVLAENVREIVDFILRDMGAEHHIAPLDFDAPGGLRRWLKSHDFEAKSNTQTHNVTVSPEAKARLMDEHGLTEKDFIEGES